jgi:iron complex outermembrane recepter protein
MDTVTVTGTRIRGAQLTSPLVSLTQEDMALAGHSDLGQALRALPQSFSGGQNPGVVPGSGGQVNQNITGGSSANLRGLGPDATLTLLNGARMAYDGYMQAVDLSVVPVAAVDRVEVLLDGASALYGSDAVGGVVNIVLKRDYDGAEITARHGRATAGGHVRTQLTGVAGTRWESGALLLTAERERNDGVLASQRHWIDHLDHPEVTSVFPDSTRTSALVSGHQALGGRAELGFDAYSLDRTSRYGIAQGPYAIRVESESLSHGVAPSLSFDVGRDWLLRVHGYAGRNDARTRQTGTLIGQTALLLDHKQLDRNETRAAGVEAEGAVFQAPAGEARMSLGAGWRESRFAQTNRGTGVAIVPEAAGTNRYAYAEIDVPLVSGEAPRRFMQTLSFSGAVRHEDYDSFGGETTPKLGVFWRVNAALDVRASWGRSFKAPTLLQQHGGSFAYLWPASNFAVAGAPEGATVLRVTGGNPDLEPERARTATAGLVFKPARLPGTTIEAGWFLVDYTQRVVRPLGFASQPLYGPTLDHPAYARYSIREPAAARLAELVAGASGFSNLTGRPYDPATVVALFDDREVNASSQEVRGVDLGLRHATEALDGTLSFHANGTWITHARRDLFAGGPRFETAGVLGYPPKFKGSFGAIWSRDAISLAGTVNHLGGIRNTAVANSPKGGSMTTFDLVLDYNAGLGVYHGFGFNLALVNALDRRPPYLQPAQPWLVNYDSSNYSALGRTVSLAITKSF